jgi:hypothetical protein
MRPATAVLVALISLGVGLAAVMADAAPANGSPAARRAALRGLQPARPRAVAPAPTRLPAAFSPLPSAPPAPDEGQCRQACAHAYFFCSAGADSDSCAGGWTSCLSDCAPAIGAPTATSLGARLLPAPRE